MPSPCEPFYNSNLTFLTDLLVLAGLVDVSFVCFCGAAFPWIRRSGIFSGVALAALEPVERLPNLDAACNGEFLSYAKWL